jgi:hypothetical protein
LAFSRQTRQHFGRGALEFDRSTSVFINCPYDENFRALFDAVIFAAVCCGFMPRSALETGTVAEPRVARILRAVGASKYSIHDLSRCKGEGDANMARFNMPLELGIAMAYRHLSRRGTGRHDWLVLVPLGHQYQTFMSDMAGFDPHAHDGSVSGIVTTVMSWLATRPDTITTPNPRQVLSVLPEFDAAMRALRDTWGPIPPWADIVLAGMTVARKFAADI